MFNGNKSKYLFDLFGSLWVLNVGWRRKKVISICSIMSVKIVVEDKLV